MTARTRQFATALDAAVAAMHHGHPYRILTTRQVDEQEGIARLTAAGWHRCTDGKMCPPVEVIEMDGCAPPCGASPICTCHQLHGDECAAHPVAGQATARSPFHG